MSTVHGRQLDISPSLRTPPPLQRTVHERRHVLSTCGNPQAAANLTLILFTCQSRLTAQTRGWNLTSEELLTVLAAIGHTQRLRIIAELAKGRVHVSELARRLELSRPLLYMHLERLQKAALVTGSLELSEDGKAMKYFEITPFELTLDVGTIVAALAEDEQNSGMPEGSDEVKGVST